ncbi:MAG TPA: LysR family transcriptional regulator [Caldimonas sp.]|jgi:DNA-binding transcriptional LysR family regulator|nr:LysR family transcriptional regulator [Caldimonas sp.]HEX2539705.1 LysR family transcriptional regulator [Caldimonas sp.]
MPHNPSALHWDDLKYLLGVGRHGSTLAAGRALKVDQSTVQRRLADLEKRIGQSLVQRQATGYRLTELGQELLPFAEAVESAVRAFEERLQALKDDASGVIRMTCPEPIVLKMTQAGLLERFHARHPRLQVQFVMSDRYVDLANGDADVALRSGDTEDELLTGRKIADSHWALFASKGYVERFGRPADLGDLSGHALVGFDETMAKHRAAQWLRSLGPDVQIASRCNSVLGLIHSVKAGVGVGPLPLPLGDSEPDLVRLTDPVPELTRSWRLLTTQELRRTPRVSAFFDFIIDEIESLRPILTG